MDCYLCGTSLTPQNDSGEHIIPNSIGGMRKVKGFICSLCNSKAGETWDTDLAEQLNKLALFFRVVRDRGDNRAEVIETTAGEKFIYDKNSLRFFKPEIRKEVKGDGVYFQVSANDMKQARQILTGLKRTYPNLDVEKTLASATAQTKYPDGYFHFEFRFGGLSFGKSLVKTALALLSVNGINPKICERANTYIFDDGEPCFGYYYHHRDLLINRPVGVPIHCVCVRGNKAERTVQAYIEYFGIVRVVFSLSANYDGMDFRYSYAIDPTQGREISIDFDFAFEEAEIRRIYEYKFYDAKVALESLHSVLPHEIQRQQEQHLEEVLARAREEMKLRFGENAHVDPDEFIEAYLNSLEPYINHLANSGRIKEK